MRSIAVNLATGCVALLTTTVCSADIRFDDVTEAAGIRYVGPTNGASWGDVNGDGFPDLFVANHRLEGNDVNLYLNLGDGTFEDIGVSLNVGPFADLHGAAWADFDNDGDQDLFALAGGGAGEGDVEGRWSYPNHLFRNDDGKLVNVAAEYGVEYPQGRGRTPLWLDVDHDGRLDVLFMNSKRPDGTSPSAVFMQRDGVFREATDDAGYSEAATTTVGEYLGILENLWNFRWRRGPNRVRSADPFAQLADIHGDRGLELVTYTDPFRIYSMGSRRLDDVTNELVFANQGSVQDAVIGDFDGDAKNDMFFLRSGSSRWWNDRARPSPVVQPGPNRIEGSLFLNPGDEPKTVRFKAAEPLTITLHPQWVPGNDDEQTASPAFRLGSEVLPRGTVSAEADESAAAAPPTVPQTEGGEIRLRFDRASGLWELQSTEVLVSMTAFVIESDGPLEIIAIGGYSRGDGRLPDSLLLNSGDNEEYVVKQLTGRAAEATACLSVVSGDFDNDMDLDLYLVCTDPVQNSANRLYENLGDGTLRLVPDAGGAAASERGRGDSAVTADYDRDGFLDLFVLNGAGPAPFGYDGPHQLFRNRGSSNSWIEIDLEGVRSNRDGIGAVVEIASGGVTQRRDQGGGMHIYSQNHQRLHFGLARNRIVDEIAVYWPSGKVQRLRNIAPNRIISIREDAR